MNVQSFFFRSILKRIQLKLFVHQKDLFVQYEKHFQGEIAMRSRDIAIYKKVPLECSDDHATHLDSWSCTPDQIQMYPNWDTIVQLLPESQIQQHAISE